ncbi:hypothetical protein [Staphylococcus saccharolyticus]|uniref:hypothetical protein n=1 Tax=Staphylococcus saccharolyticus TaxID=33028 RepID=UPI0032DEEB6D
MLLYDDKRIQPSTQFKSSEENRKNKVSPILKLIPQYIFSDSFQRTMIEIEYAKNFVWVAPTLVLIAMIDIVIEVCMSQKSYVVILTLIVLLIEAVVSIIKV